VARAHPGWRREDGGCPACLQEALLGLLLERGESAFHDGVQRLWPLDARAAFGALPTPLRLHADPRFAGRGVTIAVVDAGFYPHADLARPSNRIRAWVDAGTSRLRVERFKGRARPSWPGWDRGRSWQWHGLMTSAVAAGNGNLSHGLYRGMAPAAQLVLVQVREPDGRITNDGIARALRWLARKGPGLGVRVANVSLGGEPVEPLAGNAVDEAVQALVEAGVTVVAAAGNDGERRLVPPGSSPRALTVGGIDDRNVLDDEARMLWHGKYGEAPGGLTKPELVAPSLWVAAPLLPGTDLAAEAGRLFADRARSETAAAERLSTLKLVTPHYQHVEGTSFAAPVVSGIVACMLEANPGLTPQRVRELVIASAERVAGAPPERQGAGAVNAGRAVSLALLEAQGRRSDLARSPILEDGEVRFVLHDPRACEVRVVGRWDDWRPPGLAAERVGDGVWAARIRGEGPLQYKFVVDDRVWLADPLNPRRAPDGFGGWNSLALA
jgi:serine protease AprX